MRRRLTTGVLAGLVSVLSSTALAQATTSDKDKSGDTIRLEDVHTWTMDIDGKQYEVRPGTPTYEGTSGLFHLPSAYTLPKGKWSVSLFRDNLDRDPKDEDISIHGLTLGFGATSRLELYGNFGLQNRVNVDAAFQPGFVNDYPFANTAWQTGVGDAKLGAKYKFLDDYMGDAMGLAVRGFVKLPTADEAKGLGTGKPSYGADLIISKTLARKLDLHGSIGMQWNGDPDEPEALDLGNAVKWGVGLNVPACRTIQLQAEVTGAMYRDAQFKQTNPVDLVVGPVVWIKPGLFIRPAVSWNLNFDDRGLNSGSGSWTGKHISIGYYPGTACCAIAAAPPPPPPPPANRPPTVSCSAERASATMGETVRFTATGSDPDGDSLTYSWTSTAGTISGTQTATLDTTSSASTTSITATVRVSDGRGGTADATCGVRVGVSQQRPSTYTCESGGFSRNLARLNNVDKACLDDLASRLRRDSTSRVVVVGYAGDEERYPIVLARKRAEAAKTYLTQERQIDAGRITSRESAHSVPAGGSMADRSRSRRIELIFVPEGALVPEPTN